ncbi:hypothetical protein GCM10022255_085570 [Dactylosporangium darangshiense]|uniref:Uncharacterized protein n=1 Tax=Dactylosporangium darangshiense TaxID=579108 RepID=A0ABP8DN53_9ACTN
MAPNPSCHRTPNSASTREWTATATSKAAAKVTPTTRRKTAQRTRPAPIAITVRRPAEFPVGAAGPEGGSAPASPAASK